MDNMGHETPKEDHQAIRQLVQMLRDDGEWPNTAIEVGCWAGGTTLVLAEMFDTVFAVDHWGAPEYVTGVQDVISDNEVFRTFCQNIGSELLLTVIPLQGTSSFWASMFPKDHACNLIFIDASHDYESVKADINAWWPHLEDGGIMCGHDFNTHDGVQKAVDEFGKDGVIANVWWRRK